MTFVRPSSSHNTQTIANRLKKKYQTDAKLFNEMWKLKEQTKNVDILWEILGIHQSHNTATKQYMLRLNKKLTIVLQKTRQHFKQTYQDYKQM